MNEIKLPFYAKTSLILLGLFSFVAMLYIGQDIIVPLILSVILAILLNPMVTFLVKKGINSLVAIWISLILVSLVTVIGVILLSSQMSVFIQSVPMLMDRFAETINSSSVWVKETFNISTKQINLFLADSKTELINSSRSAIGATLTSMGNALVVLFLIPVYVFLIILYRPLLLDVVRKLFVSSDPQKVNSILTSIKTIIQKYLTALLLEAAIIATLNSVGLLVIGVDYAIVLGILGAILNIIPYIGGIVAIALPIMVIFGTSGSGVDALLVMLLYSVIQFVDNNYILPKLVAMKVRINSLVSIVVVLAGGSLWGVTGMFLSIPLTAILKIIFDHIEPMKPWGLLLGDTMPVGVVSKLKAEKKK